MATYYLQKVVLSRIFFIYQEVLNRADREGRYIATPMVFSVIYYAVFYGMAAY